MQGVEIRPSDREITISLMMSDNRAITVSQYDGEMIKTGPRGKKFGITPRMKYDGSIALEFFGVTRIIRRNAVVGEAITGIGAWS